MKSKSLKDRLGPKVSIADRLGGRDQARGHDSTDANHDLSELASSPFDSDPGNEKRYDSPILCDSNSIFLIDYESKKR